MESQRPFRNWGDWLIWRSSGAFGDFKLAVATSIIRTERYSRSWFDQFTDDDIRRILARYKEHVKFWNIPMDVLERELTEFANEVGRPVQAIFREFDLLPAKRLPPDFVNGSPIW